MLLKFLRNRRKKLELTNEIATILLHLQARRNILISKCLLQIHLLLIHEKLTALKKHQERKPRSCRRFERNKGWWELVNSTYDANRFFETFRMTRETFNYILENVRDDLIKKTLVEEPVAPDFRLAITIYKLSRGDYMYTIGEMCGLAVSTVSVIVSETCRVIVNTLWDESVGKLLPKSEEDFTNLIAKFGEEWQFPYVFGAIDGSHLPIKCCRGGAKARKQYFNFKGFYSIVLIALVDAQYRFIWASVGAPGNTHDSTLFQSTRLWKQISDGDIVPNLVHQVKDVEVPPLILGDGAFPLRPWIMKPHGDAVLSREKRYFNFRLSRARLVTEGAFGRLKSRFRILFRKCESDKENVKLYGLACVILHNLCIDRGDLVPRHFDLTVNHASNKRLSSEEVRDLLDLRNTKQKDFVIDKLSPAKKIRDRLTESLWEEQE